MLTYLESLTIRLAKGVAALPEELRRRHARYLLAAQREDGGFAGRQGGSDLYYTSFALRGLAVLGELEGEAAQKSAEFLRSRMGGRESIVDFLSLIYGASLLRAAAAIDIYAQADPNWRSSVAAALHSLRRPDGGFAKGPEGAFSSTYHTFLVLACLELIEQPVPEPQRAVDFLLSQRAEGGGFLEIKASKRAGANPTAAAVAALRMLGAFPDDSGSSSLREETIDFLCDMQTDEGGLRANTRIPIADVLSTFTGLLTLVDLGAEQELDLPRLRGFVESLQLPAGGFHAAAWDLADDVEYCFYGLGSLALLEKKNPLEESSPS